MPIKVLTNSTYDKSITMLGRFQGFGGFLPVPRGSFWMNFSPNTNSLLRFVRAADMLRNYIPQTSGPAVDYAFHMLKDIEMNYRGHTVAVWSTVYDSSNKKIYFRSSDNDHIRWIDLNAFYFSCSTPVKALAVHDELEGDVTGSFIDYSEDINRELAKNISQFVPLTDEQLEIYITYPEKYTHCTE